MISMAVCRSKFIGGDLVVDKNPLRKVKAKIKINTAA
jgi:hypothetical protein